MEQKKVTDDQKGAKKKMTKYTLECCVDSVESALAAKEGGADRLELCAGLIIGGVSPGLALFEQVKACCDLPVRVLLRPRFGDFLYTDYEFRILRREVELFREAGAEGVVIGCLNEDGGLHMEQMRALTEAAGDLKITLHRAFDVCADPIRAYEQAWELGIDTILTSGQESDCLAGLPLLKKLCSLQAESHGMGTEETGRDRQAEQPHENAQSVQMQRAGKRPQIMAGAGVTPDVIRKFRAQTDITAFHLSAKKIIDSGMRYRKEGVPMGIPAMSEYSIFRTDREIVAQAREALA